jgi:hypothetical protein
MPIHGQSFNGPVNGLYQMMLRRPMPGSADIVQLSGNLASSLSLLAAQHSLAALVEEIEIIGGVTPLDPGGICGRLGQPFFGVLAQEFMYLVTAVGLPAQQRFIHQAREQR